MTVTVNTEMATAVFVPYRGTNRVTDPMGSFFLSLTGTGDGSGGNVNLHVLSNQQEFGVHPIFVVTQAQLKDNLAATSERRFEFSSVGNSRVGAALSIPKVPIADGADFISVFAGGELAVQIEPDGVSGRNIFTCGWRTNTNTEVYTAFIFGLVWDAETIARQVDAHMPDIFYGVR